MRGLHDTFPLSVDVKLSLLVALLVGYVAQGDCDEDDDDDSHADAHVDDLVVDAAVGLACIGRKDMRLIKLGWPWITTSRIRLGGLVYEVKGVKGVLFT